MPKLLLFAEALLEMIDLLRQQVIHFEFFLDNCLQFLNVGVHVEVHITYSLDFRDQFAFLCQQLGVFLDSRHVSSKDFLLLLQNIGHLFLESEVLLANVVVFEGRFHDVYIFFDLFLVNLIDFGVNLLLYLFLQLLLVLFFTVNPVTLQILLFLLRFIY